MVYVAPEFSLTLIVTVTVPGLGEMDPDRVTEEPTVVELGATLREMVVDCRNVVPMVTGLFGMVNEQGLTEQDMPT